ncbi:MAG: septation protein A [Azoarcus sp.]|jgi:intracellular septation protein|nr:septation protein A [Azoarcus sp.]
MKFLFDLLPVIFFFAAYIFAKFLPDESQALVTTWLSADIPADQAPILIATFTAIVTSVLQVTLVWLRHRKVDRMLWVSLLIIVIFGGATLIFHDKTFIQWKFTVFYWLLAIMLLGSNLFFHRNLIRRVLEIQKIHLPDPIWSRLNLAWALFFLTIGALNLVVANNFSVDTWMYFKGGGCPALIFVFALAQGFYLSKHLIEDHPDDA